MKILRENFPSDDDGEVLFQLASKGINLRVKRKIEFTCWAGNRQTAENIVNDLETYGYQSTVFVDDGANGSGDVSVYASILMLPDHELLLAEQKRLNAILKFYGTTCDGWVTESF
ncbi:ribonuclease E inhibitor RraB [Pontixanthobacter aestiaquae]|uniref:Regulator of ribonuclease activity B domain-containing protein n=1 Tax=Pontixanthobacter aestiaquae TaxID=1509367 RepID=A0A844ZA67_9SPHN|nr:ribonuclease E inhibitor RraB [Pontixanthobacter aestiaquae]MDN3647280.1 ribonuclease E inhibitor RraB [Pontixanthobacter aestiaquae]MXO84414.1 hypothetical protein [Pontixanthobacter aestiaquae]